MAIASDLVRTVHQNVPEYNERVDAPELLRNLMSAVDQRRWSDLSQFLHPDFICRYVHTGESFDRSEWIAVNANYPGFDHLVVHDLVGDTNAAACRTHVTSVGNTGLDHFECATFVETADDLIKMMTEVWTDVAQTAPTGTRPEHAL